MPAPIKRTLSYRPGGPPKSAADAGFPGARRRADKAGNTF
jgi:hypothetical protein